MNKQGRENFPMTYHNQKLVGVYKAKVLFTTTSQPHSSCSGLLKLISLVIILKAVCLIVRVKIQIRLFKKVVQRIRSYQSNSSFRRRL